MLGDDPVGAPVDYVVVAKVVASALAPFGLEDLTLVAELPVDALLERADGDGGGSGVGLGGRRRGHASCPNR